MITSNSNVLAYRSDLFEEVDLDPDSPPALLSDLDAAAEALEIVGADGAIERGDHAHRY
ncbi:MAG: hypothetical protein R2911_29640 [Caldilineaceae bacterium]